MADAAVRPAPSNTRTAMMITAIILLSFAFGIAMFLPAEHRAEKWQETLDRYQARKEARVQSRPQSTKRIMLPASFDPLPVLDTLGGDFSLDSTLGKSLGPAAFRGELVLVNFGFTHCPDVCPTTLARMRDVVAALPDAPINVLFVTLDPERDTIEQLRPYLGAFGSQFIGLSGSTEAVAEVWQQYRVYREVDQSGNFTHSNEIYLLDQQGRTRGTFDGNVKIEEMVETVARLI